MSVFKIKAVLLVRANMAPDYIRDVTTANRNANRALQDAARAALDSQSTTRGQ